MRARIVLFSTLLGLAATAVWSQQYTRPGDAGLSSGIPSQKQLERAVEEARWQLGGVRVAPWIGFRDGSVVTTTSGDEETEDLTLTVGAGVRAYLRNGDKLTWAAQILPEYVWWEEIEDKRRLNGRYGLALFGHYNRLHFEISQRRVESQQFFSPEVQDLTSSAQDVTRLGVDIGLTDRLWLSLLGTRRTLSNEEEENAVFSLLDREEAAVRAGIELRTPQGWRLGVGVEETETDFETEARNLSNTGTSGYLQLAYEGGRFSALLDLVFRSLEPESGSAFRPFDETTGRLDTLWELSSRVNLLAYGQRSLVYAVSAENAQILNERFGINLDLKVWRGALNFIAETGDDAYTPISSAFLARNDDVTTYGGGLSLPLGQQLSLAVQVRRTEYESDLLGFDREVTTVGASLRLGGLLDRLRLGEPGGEW